MKRFIKSILGVFVAIAGVLCWSLFMTWLDSFLIGKLLMIAVLLAVFVGLFKLLWDHFGGD